MVGAIPADPEAVFFGAWVELENAANGEVHHYRIVGPDETDAREGLISIDSPLARALLRKRLDDEVEAMLPAGPVTFAIIGVRYEVAPA